MPIMRTRRICTKSIRIHTAVNGILRKSLRQSSIGIKRTMRGSPALRLSRTTALTILTTASPCVRTMRTWTTTRRASADAAALSPRLL